MESPLHEAAAGEGAVMGAVGGCAVPRHFGDPAAEYAALRDAAAVIDRSDLARLRLHGRDPVRMVQGLITNDLAGSPAGRAVYAAMLTAKGRVVAELRALRRPGESGEEVWIDLPREALEGTVEHFRHFVPPLFARVEDLGGRAGTVGIYGPGAGGVMASVFATSAPDLPEDAVLELSFHDRPVLAVRTLYTGPLAGGTCGPTPISCRRSGRPSWQPRVRARPVSGRSRRARIEAGRPRYGIDITPGHHPPGGVRANRADGARDLLRKGVLHGPGGGRSDRASRPREPQPEEGFAWGMRRSPLHGRR
jgi:hypothetical protein